MDTSSFEGNTIYMIKEGELCLREPCNPHMILKWAGELERKETTVLKDTTSSSEIKTVTKSWWTVHAPTHRWRVKEYDHWWFKIRFLKMCPKTT